MEFILEFEEIKAGFSEITSTVSAAKISIKILDYFSTKKPEELQFITYRSLSVGLDCDDINSDLIAAVSLLSNNKLPLLEAHMMLVTEENEEHEISLEKYQQAMNDGFIIHPETGDELKDFKDCLFPFFTLSELLAEAIK